MINAQISIPLFLLRPLAELLENHVRVSSGLARVIKPGATQAEIIDAYKALAAGLRQADNILIHDQEASITDQAEAILAQARASRPPSEVAALGLSRDDFVALADMANKLAGQYAARSVRTKAAYWADLSRRVLSAVAAMPAAGKPAPDVSDSPDQGGAEYGP